MRIVFMGTPAYAVPTLEALIRDGHRIVGVFCQPDKPVGRKQVLTPPPVKVCASQHGIPVYQPTGFKDGLAIETLKSLQPELCVVVAYGKILPQAALDVPTKGCINGHGSLLPAYRGASPIQWAVVNGETRTGVTTMYMDAGMDTGDILETAETPIGVSETAGELFDRMAVITAELMVRTVRKADLGTLTPMAQDHETATYTPMIRKEMACLDFSKPAHELCCAVRGYNPWPVAYTFLEGKRLKIFSAHPDGDGSGQPGQVIRADEILKVVCGNQTTMVLDTVQLEGSKPMQACDLLKGHPILTGTVLGNVRE